MRDLPDVVPGLPNRAKLITTPIDVSRITKEAGVKHIVKQLLNQFGWYFWMPAANGFGTAGVHDFNAISCGTFLTVETKFGHNKPTAQQISYAGHIMVNNGFSFCVNERNIDHLHYFLDSFNHSIKRRIEGLEPIDAHGARMLNAIAVLTDLWGPKA